MKKLYKAPTILAYSVATTGIIAESSIGGGTGTQPGSADSKEYDVLPFGFDDEE